MTSLLSPQQTVRDIALLAARLIVGVVLVAHGWQKFATWGLPTATENFDQMGVPLAAVAAPLAAVIELVGGLLLIAGAFVPLVSAAVVFVMAGAALIVHWGTGVFVADGGWELVGVIAATALALIGGGAGRYSVDHVLLSRMRTTDDAFSTPDRETVSARS